MVELRVLGPVGVSGDEGTVTIRSAKQRLILIHLALAKGKPVSEQMLVDELWERPPDSPLHALQAHVSRLRHSTALPIEHQVGGYLLNAASVGVDATRFEELLSSAQSASAAPATVVEKLEEALALWRGRALEDGSAAPGLNSHRARLELLYDEAVTRLVEGYLAADRATDALPLLYETVDRNPVDERRWGQLMITLNRAGRRSEALEVFTRARKELVELLGLEPNAQLQQIQHDILNATKVPGPGRESVHPVSRPHTLFGRDREWSSLARLWDQAQRGQRIVLLTGEPGIGKTYLASRFAEALSDDGVRSSRCHATHRAPYGPLAQLIRSDCADLDTQQVRARLGPGAVALYDVVPDVVTGAGSPEPTTAGALDPQVEHHRIKLALGDWLQRATEAAPLCLLIDDLQWADAESLRLLAELWSDTQQVPILWLVTLRDHEVVPGSPHADLLGQATRPSESVTHLQLEGLERAAIADLMQSTMGTHGEHDLSTNAVDDVLARTGGNPLFALETARHLEDGSAGVPQTLTAVVADYASRLDPLHRELLDVAAVVGEEFDPLVVGMATGRGPQELDEFLAIAQRLRLIEPARTDGLGHRFRHSLVQAAVLQQITPVRRTQLHLDVARAVADQPYTPDRLHVLAYHYVRAVNLIGADEAIRHLLAAAEASQRQRAPAVALDLYRAAHDLLSTESPHAQRCEVLLGLGEAGFRAGVDHRDDLLAAARLASQTGNVDRLVRAAVANNRGWYSNLTEVDRDRVSVVEAALAMLPKDADRGYQPSRSRLLALWAMENVRDPARRDDVLTRSSESLRIAESIGDHELVGEIMCHRFSVLYAAMADPITTFEFAVRLDDFARSRVDPDLQLKSAIAVAQSAMTVGDFISADHALERSQQLATALAHPQRLWLVRTWLATRTATRGDVEAAQAQASEALELGTSLDQPDAFTWFAGQLFVFHHMADQLPALIDAIEEQVDALTDQIPAWQAAYALALTTVERWDEAEAIIDRFRATGFAQLPVDVLYLQGLSYLADATARLGYVAAAGDIYDALLPYEGLVATNSVIDAGPIDLRLGQLALLRGDQDAAQRHLRSARTFCRDHGTAGWHEHVMKAQAALRH